MKGITNTKRMLGTLVTLTALLAIVAPVAQADPWQLEQRNIERTQPLGDASDRQPVGAPISSVDRYADSVSTHGNAARLKGYESFRVERPGFTAAGSVGAESGRDWTSVGLGAGLGVALLLAGMTAAAAVRGRGRVAHS